MKTAHRIASHLKRNAIKDLALPKFWRPKMEATQQLDAKVTHWDLVSRFSDGTATQDDLWDWMETGFTYSQMMRLLVEDGLELTDEALNAIAEQLNIYESVIDRFKRTGRIGFSAQELLIARAAASVMDGLIEADRHGIAVRAALWSAGQMRAIRNSYLLTKARG